MAGSTLERWTPAMDLIRNEDSLVLEVDLPGITLDEVKIEVEDGMLIVCGEHEDRLDDEKDKFVRRERRFGSFYRSMPLPSGVEAEQIKATCKDGLLEVTVPLPAPSP